MAEIKMAPQNKKEVKEWQKQEKTKLGAIVRAFKANNNKNRKA